MAEARDWVAGARPRTLPAAIVPVAVGSGVAAGYGGSSPGGPRSRWSSRWRCRSASTTPTTTATASAVPTSSRVGPVRLVGSGLATPRQVLAAALASFLVAGLAGLVLAAVYVLVAAAARRRRHRRGLVLHRRQQAIRVPRARRGLGLRLLRRRRRGGHRLCPDGQADLARPRRRRPGRPAGLRAARDQQPARHPHRRRPQASARSPSCSATSGPGCSTRAACGRRSASPPRWRPSLR